MAQRAVAVELSDREISAVFADPKWAQAFPPILSVDQAAELSQVPKGTIYSWSSRGLLDSCASRAGKRLLIWRNRFLQLIFKGI